MIVNKLFDGRNEEHGGDLVELMVPAQGYLNIGRIFVILEMIYVHMK